MWSAPGDGVRPAGSSFFPLDEELELAPGRLSPGVQQAVVRLGAALPFGQVPAILALLAGISVTGSLVRRYTERAGAALVAIEDARVREIEQQVPDNPVGTRGQQLSVDGAMVPIRGGAWREVKTLVIGELSVTEPGSAEQLSYVSRMQEAEDFAWSATAELHRRGTFAAAPVVAVVDGALWCQGFLDYHRPDAIRVLDFPHVVEHLSQAAQSCFGSGTAQVSEWLADQRAALLNGDPAMVVQAVADLPVEQAADPSTARQIRDQVHTYLARRRAQMTYAAFQAQGFPIASGIVESANKLVVEARLKGAGMHWATGNVDPMLALRCAICNDTWTTVWPQIVRHRRQTAHRSQPRSARASASPPPPPARAKTTLTSLPKPAPSPYFSNGKPNDTHPWKRAATCANRSPHQGITKK